MPPGKGHWKCRRLIGATFLVALFAVGAAWAKPASPVGIWLHPNQRIHVEIVPCENRLCGQIVWFRWPNDAEGLPLVDLKNPNPALRGRPLMGLQVLDGLLRAEDGTWGNGRIYNPDDGAEYQANMSIGDDDAVRVRVFRLMPIFGETLIWTRVR
ncbi:MAG: hypothetical protein A2516_09065 [Alphaproteobacteria bacterium RIFOXYD12_FULL_60_8]|nr:MAG: hypothetical protein A2516_09065 [Alphaproteobacteria bacterium RIFOXYD12_FULL_60_8]